MNSINKNNIVNISKQRTYKISKNTSVYHEVLHDQSSMAMLSKTILLYYQAVCMLLFTVYTYRTSN